MLYLYGTKISSQLGFYACTWDEQFILNECLPKVNIQVLNKDEENIRTMGGFPVFILSNHM